MKTKRSRLVEYINGVRITSMHIAVYNAIKKLSHKHGYCYAFNQIIADMCMITKSRVSHIITDLVRAGMLYRFVRYADDKKTVILRELTVIPEDVYKMANTEPDAEPDGEKMQSLAEIVENYVAQHRMSDEQQRQRGHVFSMARRLGVAPMFIVSIVLKYGKEKAFPKLEKVLSAACASSAIENIYAWVSGMMKKSNISLGKRAAREMAKPSHSVRYKTQHVARTEEPQGDGNAFLERYAKLKGAEAAARLRSHCSF